MLQVVGLASAKGADGKVRTTMHLITEFESYQNDSTQGRVAIGKAVETVYVGTLDVSKVKVGDLIDIYYGKPIPKKDGTCFAPVVAVSVVKEK